jgi:ankyrin repeat protein
MAQTRALLEAALPKDVAFIIWAFFFDPKVRTSEEVAKSGEYERWMTGDYTHDSYLELNYKTGFRGACHGAHHDMVNEMIARGYTYWNWGMQGACYGNHYELMILMHKRGASDVEPLFIYALKNGQDEEAMVIIGKKVMRPDSALKIACSYGKLFAVDALIAQGATNYTEGLTTAAEYGHANIVKSMLAYKADYRNGLWDACKNGHIDVVRLLIDHGANDWNYCLEAACKGGRLPLAELMLDHGADPNIGLIACEYEHAHIVDLMISRGATDWNRGLKCAIEGNQIPLIHLMLAKGASNVDDGLITACKKGSRQIALIMIEHGATALDEGLIGASCRNHVDLVRLMIENGATNQNNGMQAACRSGSIDVVQFMIANGANNWNDYLSWACEHYTWSIMRLMIDYGATACNFCHVPIEQHRGRRH